MKWRNVLIISLATLASFLAYNYFKQPFIKYFPEPVLEETEDLVEADEQQLNFKNLTPREKISQMLMLPLMLENEVVNEDEQVASEDEQVASEDEQVASEAEQVDFEESGATLEERKADLENSETLNLLIQYQPGFIIYFGEEITYEIAKSYQTTILDSFSQKQILPLLAVDHEGGLVQRLSGEGFTALPSMRQLTASVGVDDDQENTNLLNARERDRLLNQSAKELSEVGINLVLAPVVDYSATSNPILTSRTGNDPDKIVQIAQEYIRAFSNWQIMPVLKHFPGIGSATKDLHFGPDTVVLDKNDTLIFERLLDQYPNIGVMSAHLRLQAKLAGQACSLSKQCLDQLFEFYPETLVITDDLLMESASFIPGTNEQKALSAIAIQAIEAGNHEIGRAHV